MRALQVQDNDPDYLEPRRFKTYVQDWGKLFLEMFYDEEITLYIHSTSNKVNITLFFQHWYIMYHKRTTGKPRHSIVDHRKEEKIQNILLR